MKLEPRYDGDPVISIDGAADDQLAPVVRQRRRMETLLAGLSDDQWRARSRCAEWNPQDVILHVIVVNNFWAASVNAGVAGEPTRMLANFDPAATPPLLVEPMRSLTTQETLEQFVESNDAFLGALEALDAAGWSMRAETPPGHVAIRVLAHHAVWDTWIHERDIALPLGMTPVVEPDEVLSSLRYAAALSPALLLNGGIETRGVFALDVTDLDAHYTIEVGDSVAVHLDAAPAGAPTLRGTAVRLTEALSLREPLPADTPPEWRELLRGLEATFDTASPVG